MVVRGKPVELGKRQEAGKQNKNSVDDIYIYYHSFRRNNVDGRISSYLHSDRLNKDMCKQQALHAVGDKHGFGNETCRIIKFNLVWNGGGVMRFDFKTMEEKRRCCVLKAEKKN